MNIDLPFENLPYPFPMAIVVFIMLVIIVGMLYFFRRKHVI